MKRLLEIFQDHTGQLSSKRIAAYVLLAMVCAQLTADMFSFHTIDVAVLNSLLTAVGAFLGITILDRFAK
jgi:uncharacterized membrane protein